MREVLERYKLLFENLNYGIVISEIIDDGCDFLIKDLNEKALEYVDKKRDKVLNQRVSEIFPFINNLSLIKKMRKVFESGERLDYPFIYFENSSLKRAFNFKIIKLNNSEVAVFFNEITKDKKREEELKRIKERLELAVNGAELGVWDWNIVSDEVSFNYNWKSMLGYDELEESLNSWQSLIHKDDRYKVDKLLNEHLKGKSEIYEVEHRLKTKNGDYKWIKDIGKVVKRDINNKPLRAVGIHQDIDERKRTERKLLEQNAYFEQLFEASTEAIVLLNNSGEVMKANDSFEKLFDYKEDKIKGRNIDKLITPIEKIIEGNDLTQKVTKGKDIRIESVREKRNGEKIDVSIHAFPISLKEGQIGIYSIYNDISERKREEEKIKYLSFHDQLTGLYNRRYFENEMERLSNSRVEPISIIIADIDDLKIVNDKMGHKKGDQFIIKAAEVINNSLRKEDIAARIGGDEFAIILPYTDSETAEMIANRISKKTNNLDISLNISVGYASHKKAEDLDDLFIKADKNMYKNKDKVCG
ncbi:MAG: diguanylate cyclase domain-containing protein [Candidatus Woesearchaeota archaeon]